MGSRINKLEKTGGNPVVDLANLPVAWDPHLVIEEFDLSRYFIMWMSYRKIKTGIYTRYLYARVGNKTISFSKLRWKYQFIRLIEESGANITLTNGYHSSFTQTKDEFIPKLLEFFTDYEYYLAYINYTDRQSSQKLLQTLFPDDQSTNQPSAPDMPEEEEGEECEEGVVN